MDPQKITVRRTRPADAAAMAALHGDLEVLPNLLQVPFTNEEIWRQRLQDNQSPGAQNLHLVAERGGEVVGSAGVSIEQRLRRRHAGGLGIAVASHAQGQGVGKALMQAIVDWSDRWANLLRLELSVFTDNERAIRLYEGFGFVREGVHRGYALRSGRYVDTLSMARLHPDPPVIR